MLEEGKMGFPQKKYKKSLSVLSYVRLSILSNCCSEIIQLQLLRYLLQ